MGKFKWNAEALIADSCTIPLGGEEVTFVEFPRQTLVEFISEAMDRKFVTEEALPEADIAAGLTGSIEKRMPFKEVSDLQLEFLFTYLAKATEGTTNPKKKAFFKDLPLTGGGLSALVEMLMNLNHIDEVLTTGGNWLMLPQAMALHAGADSETPTPTMQA